MEKLTNTITRNMLIDEIVAYYKEKYTKDDITDILNCLEFNCINHLKRATEEKPIIIRLFLGLQLISKVLPEKDIMFFNKPYTRKKRIKATAKMTRYLNRKILNNLDNY